MKFSTFLLLAEAASAARLTEYRRAAHEKRVATRKSRTRTKITAENASDNSTAATYSENWAGAVIVTTDVSEVTAIITAPKVYAGSSSSSSSSSSSGGYGSGYGSGYGNTGYRRKRDFGAGFSAWGDGSSTSTDDAGFGSGGFGSGTTGSSGASPSSGYGSGFGSGTTGASGAQPSSGSGYGTGSSGYGSGSSGYGSGSSSSSTSTGSTTDDSDEYCGSAWVGIDGDTCETAILQTGIDFCYENGEMTYDAWYEWYPDYAYDFDLTVSEGDTIKMTVTATSDTAGTAVIENQTTGKSVTKSFSDETSGELCRENAEWIVEDFEEGESLVPFANFSTITFTSATAKVASGTVGPSDSSASIFDIQQSNEVLTSCSTSDDTLTCSYE